MEIFKVTICSFESVERTNFSYRYVKNINSRHEIFCIKYGEEFIDINTNKKYYLIKKDKDEIILKEEYGNIDLNVDYALNFTVLGFRDKSIDLIVKAINAKRQCKKEQKILKR